MEINQRKTPSTWAAALVLTLGCLAVLPGCYRRVVDARGPGADRYAVEEPYQQNSRLDEWFYGDRPSGRSKTPLERRR